MKTTQILMVWFLPLIVIGGLFYPLLGYVVVSLIAILLSMSIFRGRYWCWNLCPRGAFLDIVLSKVSLKRPLPRSFARPWFRWMVFFLLMIFLAFRIIRTGGNWIAIGSVFVGMCVLTTAIAIILGVATKHRGWCAICPMGTLQDKISRSVNKKGKP